MKTIQRKKTEFTQFAIVWKSTPITRIWQVLKDSQEKEKAKSEGFRHAVTGLAGTGS